jgi:hypothetical protein
MFRGASSDMFKTSVASGVYLYTSEKHLFMGVNIRSVNIRVFIQVKPDIT